MPFLLFCLFPIIRTFILLLLITSQIVFILIIIIITIIIIKLTHLSHFQSFLVLYDVGDIKNFTPLKSILYPPAVCMQSRFVSLKPRNRNIQVGSGVRKVNDTPLR